MGYQFVKIPGKTATYTTGQYSFFTITFKKIGANTALDLTDLVPCDSTGKALSSSKNEFWVQKLNSQGGLDSTTYKFTTSSSKGWCIGSNAIKFGDCPIADGEGIYVFNSRAESSGDVGFNISGEVDLTPLSETCASKKYALIGNMTPVDVYIQDIIPCDENGVALTSSKNNVWIQMLESAGKLSATTYKYTTSSGKGWCIGSNAIPKTDEYKVKSGQGMYIYNGESKPITLKFPSPIDTGK